MTITFVSVLVALLVGGIETLGLVRDRIGASGAFWNAIASLNRNFGAIGYLIIALFVASWILAAAIYRLKGYDALESGETPA
jgi:high-affinity nickel-transport protein